MMDWAGIKTLHSEMKSLFFNLDKGLATTPEGEVTSKFKTAFFAITKSLAKEINCYEMIADVEKSWQRVDIIEDLNETPFFIKAKEIMEISGGLISEYDIKSIRFED